MSQNPDDPLGQQGGAPSPGQAPYGQPPHGQAPYGQPPSGPQSAGPPHGATPQPSLTTQAGNDPYRSGRAGVDTKGFFSKLFDFSFSEFITLSFAKVIYGLVIIVVAIGWLVMVITAFGVEPLFGIGALLLGWIPALIYIVLIRVALEASIALIRTAQNTTDLVRRG